MVWLISFLTFSNIAIGYGLAVYFHQHYGSALPSCGRLKIKKSVAPAAAAVAAEVPTASLAATREKDEAKVVKAESPEPVETDVTLSTSPAEDVGGLPPVDEENVLAGIEEFRSQLARMNVAAAADTEAAVPEGNELVGAAN